MLSYPIFDRLLSTLGLVFGFALLGALLAQPVVLVLGVSVGAEYGWAPLLWGAAWGAGAGATVCLLGLGVRYLSKRLFGARTA
jgi:hypothetical protein